MHRLYTITESEETQIYTCIDMRIVGEIVIYDVLQDTPYAIIISTTEQGLAETSKQTPECTKPEPSHVAL